MPNSIMSAECAQMYAAIGSELEHTLDNAWRVQFARAASNVITLRQPPPSPELGPLEALSRFAHAKGSAVCERLAGRITQAQLYEQRAEEYYQDLPADCRW